jgi:Ser/Thr protein kinase RdoA (MazF antagonist)
VVGVSRLGHGPPALAGAAAAIARAYGLDGPATLAGPVDRGELGEIWRLDTGQGRYAVKVPFEPVDPAELEEPAAFADAVAGAGVATPKVLRAVDGSVVETVAGQQVVLLEWLDLLPPDTALDPADVGRLLAGIHRVPFAGTRPPIAWFSTPVGEARWRDLVAMTRREGAPFAEHLADYVGALVALEALLDPLPADRTCHRDLWADNVRGLRGGGLCVFDWDSCGPGSQSEELGLVLFEFGRGVPARHRAIRDAYRDAGGAGRVDSLRAFSMLIAHLSHIGEYQVKRWLGARPGSAERDRASGAVEEFVGLPPHPRLDTDALEAILDDVTGLPSR